MEDFELTLFDRLEAIRSTIAKYGEENFYLSFSGGKDSTMLSALIDEAIPNNKIKRVYCDTGIDLQLINNFVYELAKTDERIIVIKPEKAIKKMLDEEGYPFKSKEHSYWLKLFRKFQTIENHPGLLHYLNESPDGKKAPRVCPKILKFQFSMDYPLKISDNCCINLKEKPLNKWQKENGVKITITGIMRTEGGRRSNAKCIQRRGSKIAYFNPLAPISKEFENWYIATRNVKLCEIYYPPYNFVRTGCVGCPYALDLEKELDILEKYFPLERKRAEIIWKPIYEEYRRLKYRLKK